MTAILTPYAEGHRAGRLEFEAFEQVHNPYAYGTTDHDEFERGWSDGYDEALMNSL